jgi:NADP-dependent 3-hydroxy acid dehydrogenase YdfG
VGAAGVDRSEVRCALVTGASSGIGRELAVLLGSRGMRVWLVGRASDRLREVARAVREAGGEPYVVRADLQRDDDLAAVVDAVGIGAGAPDGLDVLVHAAGVASADAGAAPSADEIAWHHAVNTRAPEQLTTGLRAAVQRRRGLIVVVNSVSGLRDVPGFQAYALSKQAARAWADALRSELAATGVRVCSIYPTQVASPMQAAICAARGAPYEPDALLQPTDLAALVGFVLDHPAIDVTDVSVRSARAATGSFS